MQFWFNIEVNFRNFSMNKIPHVTFQQSMRRIDRNCKLSISILNWSECQDKLEKKKSYDFVFVYFLVFNLGYVKIRFDDTENVRKDYFYNYNSFNKGMPWKISNVLNSREFTGITSSYFIYRMIILKNI